VRYRQQILSAAESLYASEISVAKLNVCVGDEGNGVNGVNGVNGGEKVGGGTGRGGVIRGERPVSPMSPSPAGGNGNGNGGSGRNEGGSHEDSIQALWRMMGEMELSQESKEKKMAIREKVSFFFSPSSCFFPCPFFLSFNP